MKVFLLLTTALVAGTLGAPSKTRQYNWVVTRDVQILSDRTLIVNTINGKPKGPAIYVHQGDMVEVKVTNRMPDAGLSVHWHGLEQRGYQMYDGPVQLVQCAIAPGESMTYKFEIQERPGTYWYHPHNEAIPAGHDFIRGPIIVLDDDTPIPSDPLNYRWDNQVVLMYHDFYPNYLAHDYLLGLGGLRGLGGFDAEGGFALTAPWSGGALNGGQDADFMQFENGEYRFRVINGGSLAPLIFSIDNHKLSVVATDGSEVEPYEVDAVQVHLGERYDVMVKFDVSEPTNVWMRGASTAVTNPAAVMLTTLQLRPNTDSDFLEGPATTSSNPGGVLMNCDYFGEQDNCIPVTALKTKDYEFAHRPILPDTEVHTADFFFALPPTYAYFFSLDGRTYTQNALLAKPMTYPSFDDSTDMTAHTNLLDLDLDKTVTLVLRNEAGMGHPIHVHGHKFEVLEEISRPKQNCFGDNHCEKADLDTSFSVPVSELAKTTKRGVLKDTIIVPMFGAAVIRFNTDNPGVWFVHCHFDEHVDSGQGFIIREGKWRASYVPEDFPSCDYTGTLQGMHGRLCTCNPKYLDPTWLCSKEYLCNYQRGGPGH